MSDAEYGLVMPFVSVESNGGLHNDRAYVAGFRLGTIDHTLRTAPREVRSLRFLIQPDDVAQLDLIAMHHGFRMRTVDVSHGWLAAILRRAA